MSTFFFERLRAERERLGLTQEQMAAVAGVTRRPYVEWEKGTGPSPNVTQLAGMAAAGADVQYIVVGQRSQGAAEVELLPPDERVLIDAYRRCQPDARRHLIQSAALLSAGVPAAPAATSTNHGVLQHQHNEGGNNLQIGQLGVAPRRARRR